MCSQDVHKFIACFRIDLMNCIYKRCIIAAHEIVSSLLVTHNGKTNYNRAIK